MNQSPNLLDYLPHCTNFLSDLMKKKNSYQRTEFKEHTNSLKYALIKSNLNNFFVKIPCIHTPPLAKTDPHTTSHTRFKMSRQTFIAFINIL